MRLYFVLFFLLPEGLCYFSKYVFGSINTKFNLKRNCCSLCLHFNVKDVCVVLLLTVHLVKMKHRTSIKQKFKNMISS